MPDFISQRDYDHMERIDDEMLQRVMKLYDEYDPNSYTDGQVRAALSKSSLSIEDFAALLSPAAFPYLEQMAQKAKHETTRQFGNSVCLYTPLYIANYCTNHCVYCGFNCKNQINRGKLNLANPAPTPTWNTSEKQWSWRKNTFPPSALRFIP